MSKNLGEFSYVDRVKIYWSKGGNIHTVTKYEQLEVDSSYEELCYENTQPTIFMTTDPIEAWKIFSEWVKEFIK